MEDVFHTPVLLQEVIDGLHIQNGRKYIDATIGGGGHAIEILRRGGKVLGIDVDQEALDYVKGRWKIEAGKWNIDEKNLELVRGNFKDIGEIAKANGFKKVAGIVFDLGVSLHQVATGERGFSFIRGGPLDMRMDKFLKVKASDLVNGLYEHELVLLFERYGNEWMASRIARAICRAREVVRIETTGQLTKIIESVVGRQGKIHPATKVFQALRIAVNDELGSLGRGLPQAIDIVEQGGRIAIISFHSLEDRIVKNMFGKNAITKKPIEPKEKEIKQNPRARSAKLRIYEKN